MSVTKEGIKGYEYQYKVSVLVSLLLNNSTDELFIEIEGSEDALLKFKQDGVLKQLEIQVKRENNILTVPILVDWLCHFQERKSDNNLLSRITTDNTSSVLFVTHSRCDNDTLILKTHFKSLSSGKKITINEEWKDKFVNELANYKHAGTSLLNTSRNTFCKNQARNYKTVPNLSQVLNRIAIWSETSDEMIDEEVLNLLNKKYLITISKTEDVYLRLLEIIKDKGRDSGVNVIPYISDLLMQNKIGSPILDKAYISRVEEQSLIDHLDRTNILLLSGISQCGKSEIAKKIAHHFYSLGYDYLMTDDIDDIRRFFSSNLQDTKVAILEDPFGQIDFDVESITRKKRIESLIKNSQPHHKLIITSKKEILYELFQSNNLLKCRLLTNDWFDLTNSNLEILKEFWLDIATKKSLPKSIIDRVSKELLNSESNPLQYGQLVYLASSEMSDIEHKSLQELEHIARSNAKEIAQSINLKNNTYSELLSVLALCSNTIQSIGFQHLAYILSDCKEPDVLITEFGHSFFGNQDNLYPEYQSVISFDSKTKEALSYLEERQFIKIQNDKITFSHPNYFEAGRYCFFSTSSIKQSHFLKMLRRCLTCISPDNVFLVTKQFHFLYTKLEENSKSQIIDYAFEFRNSIYPLIQDNCILFLATNLDDLDTEKGYNIVRAIQGGIVSDSDIHWHNKEIPYMSEQGNLFSWLEILEKEEFIKIENKLSSNTILNAYEIWFYLKSHKEYGAAPIDYLILTSLFQSKEAFIRAKIAEYAILKSISNLAEFVKLVFKDENPSVVFSAIRAIFMNWYNYSTPQQTIFFDLIKDSLSNKLIAIRTNNLLSTFSIDYSYDSILNWKFLNESQKKDLWSLWAKIYPISIKDLPINIFIHTPRFAVSMDDAIEYLDIDEGLTIIESWYDRIDSLIRRGKLLDAFELSIADYLMKLTKNDFKIRKTIFTNLINYNDTSFVLSNLQLIAYYWENLDITEKEQVLNLIKGNRKDLRWIKATLLCSHKLHDEIVFEILGEKDLLSQKIEYIVSKFPEQLLKDCLHIFCGFPQPLWWLALHHKNSDFWNQVMRYILVNESHTGFDICIEEFLREGVNGAFYNEWSDGLELWEKICTTVTDKTVITNSLIKNTSQCSCAISTTKNLWSILFESYKISNQENELISLIVDNIEVLQQTTGDKKDLLEFFDNELFDKIIQKLIPDGNILELLVNTSLTSDEKNERFFNTIPAIIDEKPVRFFITFDYAQNISDDKLVTKEIREYFASIPNLIDKVGEEKLSILEQKFEYELDDWIDLRR